MLTPDERFNRFWESYPRHEAKAEALKAWHQLDPSRETVELMIIALTWQRVTPAWTKDGGAYIPHPASWIRGRRWEDEPFQTTVLFGKQSTRLAHALRNIKEEEK